MREFTGYGEGKGNLGKGCGLHELRVRAKGLKTKEARVNRTKYYKQRKKERKLFRSSEGSP